MDEGSSKFYPFSVKEASDRRGLRKSQVRPIRNIVYVYVIQHVNGEKRKSWWPHDKVLWDFSQDAGGRIR